MNVQVVVSWGGDEDQFIEGVYFGDRQCVIDFVCLKREITEERFNEMFKVHEEYVEDIDPVGGSNE